MERRPGRRPVEWSGIAILASLGALVVFSLALKGLSLARFLTSLGFIAGFILIAYLWQITMQQQAETPQDSPTGGRLRSLAVLLGLAAALAAVTWAIRSGLIR